MEVDAGINMYSGECRWKWLQVLTCTVVNAGGSGFRY